MKTFARQLGWLAAVVASVAGMTLAQAADGDSTAAAAAPGAPRQAMMAGHEHGPRGHDPARMQARFERHLAELKAQLKLGSEQEAAWATFSNAVKPPATPPAHPDPAELAKLSTPERLDRMEALHQQHSNEMAQRHQAIKTFYATLSAEQKKTFDAATLRLMHPMHDRGHGMPGPRHPG